MFTIEKNIPIPERRGENISQLRSMEVGDSFLLTSPVQAGSIIGKANKIPGYRFISRKIHGEGYRIWRVE